MGAKVAIGVFVPLAAIGAALLASFLFRKRKSKSKVQGRKEYSKAELPGDTRVSVAQDPNEMDATGEHITHVPYNGPPVELPAQEMRYAGWGGIIMMISMNYASTKEDGSAHEDV
jgi:hypothetical protein